MKRKENIDVVGKFVVHFWTALVKIDTMNRNGRKKDVPRPVKKAFITTQSIQERCYGIELNNLSLSRVIFKSSINGLYAERICISRRHSSPLILDVGEYEQVSE